MPFLETMAVYFRGEKLEALYFILPAGLVLCTLAIVAMKAESGGYAWGVAVPCLCFGLVLAATGANVGLRTERQVDALRTSYAADPVTMAEAELERMTQVNRNFRLTYYSFGVIALIALALHYLGGPSWGRGLGASLLLIASVGLLVDGFAERRAEPYTAALKSIGDR